MGYAAVDEIPADTRPYASDRTDVGTATILFRRSLAREYSCPFDVRIELGHILGVQTSWVHHPGMKSPKFYPATTRLRRGTHSSRLPDKNALRKGLSSAARLLAYHDNRSKSYQFTIPPPFAILLGVDILLTRRRHAVCYPRRPLGHGSQHILPRIFQETQFVLRDDRVLS